MATVIQSTGCTTVRNFLTAENVNTLESLFSSLNEKNCETTNISGNVISLTMPLLTRKAIQKTITDVELKKAFYNHYVKRVLAFVKKTFPSRKLIAKDNN